MRKRHTRAPEYLLAAFHIGANNLFTFTNAYAKEMEPSNMTPVPAEDVFFVGDRCDGLSTVPKVFAESDSKLTLLSLVNGICFQINAEEFLVYQLTAEEFPTRKIQAEDFRIPF